MASSDAALPAPLVPPEVDLRDYGYMPLDVVRLRDSEMAVLASGEEFKAAVLLWAAAWHQVPAGSLPDNDRMLAHYSGAGAQWREVRDGALRGFVLCADGRLYHPVIAQKAIEAWSVKQAQRARTRAATEARGRAPQRNAGRYVTSAIERDAERNVERDVERNVDRNVERDVGRNVDRNVERDADRNVHQVKGNKVKGNKVKGEKVKGKKTTTSATSWPTLPDWLPPDLWQHFREHRRRLGKPMTCEAERLNLRELDKLRAAGEDAVAVVQQSIAKGWQGLFPVKGDGARNMPSMGRTAALEARNRAAAEAWLRESAAESVAIHPRDTHVERGVERVVGSHVRRNVDRNVERDVDRNVERDDGQGLLGEDGHAASAA